MTTQPSDFDWQAAFKREAATNAGRPVILEEEIAGAVKWDGCADWHTDCVHFCGGAGDVDEIAACLRAAYTLAADVMGDEVIEFGRPDFTPLAVPDGWILAPTDWP